MTTPTWSAAVTGQPTAAGGVDQFLGTHAITWLYTGARFLDSSAGSAGSGLTTLSEYIDLPFTMPSSPAQTVLARVELYYSFTGTPPDVTFTVQTDNGSGQPSGTVLQTIVVPADFWLAQLGVGWLSIPIALTGLTAGTKYHLVSQPAGTAGNIVTFSNTSTIPTGFAAVNTSTNGTSWTAGSTTLRIGLINGNTGSAVHSWEDSGARWTTLTPGPVPPLPAHLLEYTAGSATQIRSTRTFSYSNGLLIGMI